MTPTHEFRNEETGKIIVYTSPRLFVKRPPLAYDGIEYNETAQEWSVVCTFSRAEDAEAWASERVDDEFVPVQEEMSWAKVGEISQEFHPPILAGQTIILKSKNVRKYLGLISYAEAVVVAYQKCLERLRAHLETLTADESEAEPK
jgi:hypothetical protein